MGEGHTQDEVPQSAGIGTGQDVRWAFGLLTSLALFITLLNAIKPITVDDSVYYLFAVHIAEHPLDPYGFRAWGVQEANTILAPPVFLYWWAGSVKLFGSNPVLWKCGLLPFNLLLVFALYALGRRFARGLEVPFVCLVALSPVVLPCVNMMLDVPCLALSLTAVLVFFRACEANSWRTALAAGLIAGIAAQTKYTAFVVPAIVFVYAVGTGRWRLGVLAGVVAVMVFVGWEIVIAQKYGQSHFVLGALQYRAPPSDKLKLVQPLFGYLGSTMACGLPLALLALGGAQRLVRASLILIVALYAFLAVPMPMLDAYATPSLTGVLFGIIGAMQAAMLATVAWRLLRTSGPRVMAWFTSLDGFLVLWLALEVAAYFALSPYPATRRVIGIVVIGTLLACRLASRLDSSLQKPIWEVVGLNAVLALFLFAMDCNWYDAQRTAAQDLAAFCKQQEPNAKVWYFGNGAFEFYAECLGMSRLLAFDRDVKPGDWVLIVGGFEPEFARHPIATRCVPQSGYEFTLALPVRSQYQYGNVAITRQVGPSVRVSVARVQ